MDLRPSLNLVWKLAAREMAAGQFKEIEPEHFCMALLKFAELSAAAVEADDEHAAIAQAIAADVESVRESLQKRGIESTRARRTLRVQLGKGATPHHHDGQVHRSAASRALFESAANLAQVSGCDAVTPLHLLAALVRSPTPAIAQAVFERAAASPQLVALPVLDKHGKDLVKEASEGRLKADPAAEVASKAVLQILLQKERKSILLVSDEDDLAEGVAITIACTMAGKEPPTGLKGRRLIDIAAPNRRNPRKGIRLHSEAEAVELERLRQFLAEAASRPEIILLVPPLEVKSESAGRGQMASLLQEILVQGKAQFICRVPPKIFTEHLGKDAVWKRRTEAVWLEKDIAGSIPREL